MGKAAARSRRFNDSPKGKYRTYRYVARRRRIRFSLSFGEFVSFWRRPCFYCGYPIRTIGLDRINNKLGYRIGNIRACCLYCNRSKADLTEAKFLDHCLRVVLSRMLRMKVLRRRKMVLPSSRVER